MPRPDGGDLVVMAAAQLRPQQVPARIAGYPVFVGMGTMEMKQRSLVLLAHREDEVAARHGLCPHPAQPLLHGDEARHFLVDRRDPMAAGPRLAHSLAIFTRH